MNNGAKVVRECDLHVHETIVPQNGHQFVQLFGLKAHTTGQIVIFETVVHDMSHEVARKIMKVAFSSPGCSMSYLHRMTSKLVQDDDIFWLVKPTCDVLNEETECLLFFLGGHPTRPAATASKEPRMRASVLRMVALRRTGCSLSVTRNKAKPAVLGNRAGLLSQLARSALSV